MGASKPQAPFDTSGRTGVGGAPKQTGVGNACEIGINLIAHTLQHTTLGQLAQGVRVNLEIDLIARYVERMLSLQSATAS